MDFGAVKFAIQFLVREHETILTWTRDITPFEIAYIF